MKCNETVASRRRIGPIKAIDASLDPVTDFSAPGSKLISVNNGAWEAPAGAIVPILEPDDSPSGLVYYQGSEPDASAQGFVSLRLADVCLERVFTEYVEPLPQGIPAGTEDEDLLHMGPLEAKDVNGDPVLGGVGIDVHITINGAKLQVPTNAITEILDGVTDRGFYDLLLDPSEVPEAGIGWTAVRIGGACQEFVMRLDVVDPDDVPEVPVIDVEAPTVEVVTPPEGELDEEETIVMDVADNMEIAYIAAFARLGTSTRKEPVFRRGTFEPGYTVGSFVEEVDDPDVRYRLHIKRDTAWPPGDVAITIDAVDGGGNLDA